MKKLLNKGVLGLIALLTLCSGMFISACQTPSESGENSVVQSSSPAPDEESSASSKKEDNSSEKNSSSSESDNSSSERDSSSSESDSSSSESDSSSSENDSSSDDDSDGHNYTVETVGNCGYFLYDEHWCYCEEGGETGHGYRDNFRVFNHNFKNGVCDTCGYEKDVCYGNEAASGHSYVSEVREATCQAPAHTYYYCEYCYFSYITVTGNLSLGDHNFDDEGICDCCGKVADWHKHTLFEGKGYMCEDGMVLLMCNCGYWEEEFREGSGHSCTLEGDTYPATCKEDGYTEYRCEYCYYYIEKKEIVPALGHTTEGGTPATCEAAAICGRAGCGESFDEPKGHDYGEWERITEPTCTEKGLERRVCSRDNTHKEEQDIDALGHTTENGTPATCTEGAVCGRCGESYDDALGHTTGGGMPATCTESAVCGRCGNSYGDPLGHNITNYDEKQPTCVDIGWNAYEVCSRGDYTTYSEIPATGNHVYQDGRCKGCYKYETNGLTFEGKSGKAVLKSVNTALSGANLVIPKYSNDYGEVVEIASNVVTSNKTVITSVTIPSTVKTIESGAFYGCTNIQAVYVESLEAWLGITFGSDNANPLYYGADLYVNGEKLQGSLSVPNGYGVGKYQFINYKAITGVEFASNNGGILAYAFSGCTGLKSVTGTVTWIAEYAFSGCTALETVALTCTQVYMYAFSGATIASLTLNTGNLVKYALSGVTAQELVLGESLQTVAQGALYNCLINSLTLPFVGDSRKTHTDDNQYPLGYIFGTESYTYARSYTQNFYGVSGRHTSASYYIPNVLNSVTITGGEILYGAFSACPVSTVVLGNNVTTIRESAFSGASLRTLKIGVGLTFIGEDAFHSCDNLEDVYYADNITKWMEITFENGLSNPLYYASKLYRYNWQAVTDLMEVGNEIKPYAFYGYKALKRIWININNPEKRVVIGESAFEGCGGLKSVEFVGDYQIDIGERAFAECTALTDLEIAETVKAKVDSEAFSDCGALETLTIDGVESIGNQAFENCNALTNVTLENVIDIGDNAFKNCKALTELTLGNSITSIGSGVLAGCESFDKLSYQGTIAEWAVIDFSGVLLPDFAIQLSIGGALMRGSLTIPEGITTVKNYAFAYCNIHRVELPATLTQIGYSAFEDCHKLVEIYNKSNLTIDTTTLNTDAEYIYTEEGASRITRQKYNDHLTGLVLYTVNSTEIYMVDFIEEGVVVEEHLYQIKTDAIVRQYACYNQETIKTLIVGKNDYFGSLGEGKEIGAYAFAHCKNLSSVSFTSSLSSGVRIEEGAFRDCTALKTFTMNRDENIFGKDVFTNSWLYNEESNWENGLLYVGDALVAADKNITGICEIKSGTHSIADEVFSGCTNLTKLIIPATVKKIGNRICTGCSSLTAYEVNSVNSVYKTTGDGALYKKAYGSQLILMDIPDSKTSFTISSNVTRIEQEAGGGSLSYLSFATTSGWKYQTGVNEWGGAVWQSIEASRLTGTVSSGALPFNSHVWQHTSYRSA